MGGVRSYWEDSKSVQYSIKPKTHHSTKSDEFEPRGSNGTAVTVVSAFFFV